MIPINRDHVSYITDMYVISYVIRVTFTFSDSWMAADVSGPRKVQYLQLRPCPR